MPPSQRPAEKPETDLLAGLIERLSPERRRELVEVAAQNRLLELLGAHQRTTLEEFFAAVRADGHWSVLKRLVVSDVITVPDQTQSGTAAAESHGGDPTGRQMQLSIVPPTPAEEVPAAAAPAGESSRAASRKRGGDVLEEIISLVASNPGLRSEQIQKQLGKPALLVKSSLVALRKAKRLRIEGERRATRYFVSTAE